MVKNKKSRFTKKISWCIIPTILLGMIFPFISIPNQITSKSTTNQVVNSSIDTLNNDTSSIVLKTPTDNSKVFAGSIFYNLNSSNNSQYYQNQIFDSFLEIENPVTNGAQITKRVEAIDYKDDEGKLTIRAKISPWLDAGNVNNTFTTPKDFTITGFKAYDAPTIVGLKNNYPTDKKPSEIDQGNISDYIEIINLPNYYEKQPRYDYQLKPNDNDGVLDVKVTLSTAIVENPSNNTFYYQNSPKFFNIKITNLQKQPSTIFPSSNVPLNGLAINKIASQVDQYDIKRLIFDYSKATLPPDFDYNFHIFEVIIIEANNNKRQVTFNAKIYNYYNSEGILIPDKINAVELTSITINNLKNPITTSVTLKKDGTNDVLAQTICDTKSDKEIIDEYVQIDNQPSANDNFSIRIDQKNYNNLRGEIELILIMKNYYELGSIIYSDSKPISIFIKNFKTVNPSITTVIDQVKNIHASDINFTSSADQNYIGNFIDNSNYPENTDFKYRPIDIDNSKGLLKLEVTPNQWYDNYGRFFRSSSSNLNRIELIIDGFITRGETTVIINPDTTTNELIGNIYPTDVKDDDIHKYIKFDSVPPGHSQADYVIDKVIRRNSAQSISFNIILKTYYDQKGLLVTPQSGKEKTIKMIIKGFKYRGKSFFSSKDGASNILPSDVNDNNWKDYVNTDLFPPNTTFTSLSYRPLNKDGTLLFSSIPSRIYDTNGDDVVNSSNERIELFITGMKTKNETTVTALQKSATNKSLFDFFPEKINDDIVSSNNKKDILKQYINFKNPFSDSLDDFDIIYDPINDIETKYDNIAGSITFKVILKNYYDNLGNPKNNVPKKPIKLTVYDFKKIVPNFLINPDVNKNLSSVDPYILVNNPEQIKEYITFTPQIDIPESEYSNPEIEIIEVTGGDDGNSLLDKGSVVVNYRINKYFDKEGKYIDKGSDVTLWDTQSFIINGFKSRLTSNSNIDFVSLIFVVVAIITVVVIIIISLSILFRKKKYYINENYDRGLINANETTIPIVISTNDKIKNSKPKLIPLLKEQKPYKPLKQYKEIKHKEAKVKPPKQPILPGQRRREMIETLRVFKTKISQKMKSAFDFNKFPINEPFEINDQWYFRNEEDKYFISHNDEWIETTKPKNKKKQKTVKKTKKDNKN